MLAVQPKKHSRTQHNVKLIAAAKVNFRIPCNLVARVGPGEAPNPLEAVIGLDDWYK